MKSKKTLKQKICLSILATSGALAIGGTVLFGVGSIQKNNKVKEFTNSNEYKQIISQELKQAEEKYQTSEQKLENLEEYYNTSTVIYSFDHAEEILDNSTNQAGKEYDSKRNIQTIGGALFGAGILSVAAIGNFAFPIKKKEENKSIIENEPTK